MASVSGYAGILTQQNVPTYRVDFGALAVGGAGNAVQIIGSATTTVKIIQFAIWKPSVNITVTLRKQSTADSGGTSTTPTPLPMSTASAAATAVVKLYTAAPTQGTIVALLFTLNMTPGDTYIDQPGDAWGQPIVLNGVAQAFAITADAAVTLRGFIEFTES